MSAPDISEVDTSTADAVDSSSSTSKTLPKGKLVESMLQLLL